MISLAHGTMFQLKSTGSGLLYNRFITLLIITLLATGLLPGNAQAKEDIVDLIRSEIELMEQRLSDVEAGRKGVIEQLQTLNRKLDLRHRLIKELKRDVSQSTQRVKALDHKIHDLDNQIIELNIGLSLREDELAVLKQDVGARLSKLYRHMAKNRAGLLLGARDLNDLFQRRKYLKAIERSDRSQINRYVERRDEISYEKNVRTEFQKKLTIEQATRLSELERTRSLLSQRLAEERLLAKEKGSKTDLLGQITGNFELLRALLDDRRSALQEIENQISMLDRQKLQILPSFDPKIPFSKLKGKLSSPLAKSIVSMPFGSIRHPELGTITVNPGVDLKASPGEPVYACAYGQVTRITYLRGFGNTVILDHSDGYYTVYSRLGSIIVSEGEVIEAGRNLGFVGNTGTEGDFHFEIWSNRKTQSPMKWLKR